MKEQNQIEERLIEKQNVSKQRTDNQFVAMNESQNEERLIEKQNVSRQRIASNRLILVTSINILLLLSVIFDMCWYQWIWVELQVLRYGKSSTIISLWVNLLYVKIEGQNYYQTFQYAQSILCQQQDLLCSTIFLEFKFVGFLCFGIFMVGALFQLFDLISMFYYSYKNQAVVESQDEFRHFTAIFAYFIGQTLFVFGTYFIDPLGIAYGVSFWLNLGTILLFLAVIIYQQFSLRQLRRQQLILELIQAQKVQNARHLQKIIIEMSSQSQFQI